MIVMDRTDFDRPKTSLRRVLTILATIYVIATIAAWIFATPLAFRPPPASYGPGEPGIVLLKEYGVPTIAVRYQPGPPQGPVLLLSHGNAEDLGHIAAYQRALASTGVAVCAWDYPGYGASSGQPGFEEAERSVLRVYDWLLREQGVTGRRVVLWGRSLGSGPSCWLAERREVAGLVLENSFTSLYRVMTRVPLFFFDRWDNERVVAGLKVPVLVIHGRDDGTIAFHHGESLAAAAGHRAQVLWLDGLRHNDQDDGTRVAAIAAFARTVISR